MSGVSRPVTRELVVDFYGTVSLIRQAELKLKGHIESVGFAGFWHPGIGQEGLQVGAVGALRRDDFLFQAHRGLGYAVAKGLGLTEIFGDLLGKTTGTTRGKGGGTVHFVAPDIGIMGQGGTLGSGFPLACGAAISAQLLGDDRVATVFFGEGAASRGTFYEAAIEAGVWRLPVVFVCENNGWAISARFRDHSPTAGVAERAAAFGFPGVVVDGQDALAVHEVMVEAVARARAGAGPTLVEALTLRERGHYEGDRQRYRAGDEDLDPRRGRDPLAVLRERLDDEEASLIDAAAMREVEEAFAAALAAPEPADDVAFRDVWAP